MEQRDYLKRQIDQMARVLGKLLADLFGLKNHGQINEGIEISNLVLNKELDLDLDAILEISPNKIIDVLITEKGLSNNALEKIAEILYLIADGFISHEDNQTKTQKLFERALEIYNYLEKEDTTFSFERNMKINRIKKIL